MPPSSKWLPGGIYVRINILPLWDFEQRDAVGRKSSENAFEIPFGKKFSREKDLNARHLKSAQKQFRNPVSWETFSFAFTFRSVEHIAFFLRVEKMSSA